MSTEDLTFPQVKADTPKCREYIDTLEELVLNPNARKKEAPLHLPPRSEDWDVQLIAALDELEYYRELEKSFQRSFEKFD